MTTKDNIYSAKAGDYNDLQTSLHHSPERLFPMNEESSEIVVSCYRGDYSASRLAHAVEDADAHLLNLNLTSEVTPQGEIVVDLRVSHRDAMSVVRSLERYGYSVVQVRGHEESVDKTLMDRVSELLVHINV